MSEYKLPTVSVELNAYDLMVLEDAIHRTEGQGWSSDESNDRAKVRDKLIEAWGKLPTTPARPSCWRCDGTKRIEVRKYFPATKYQREGVLITDEPCPRCVGRTDGAP